MFSKRWLSFCYQVPVIEKCLELGLLCNVTPYKFCLERMPKHFKNNEIKEIALNAAAYYFWIDCGLWIVIVEIMLLSFTMRLDTQKVKCSSLDNEPDLIRPTLIDQNFDKLSGYPLVFSLNVLEVVILWMVDLYDDVFQIKQEI